MLHQGYEHEPLSISDAWRCLYHARCHFTEGKFQHPREAYDLLWEAQDAATGRREINLASVFERERKPEDGRFRSIKYKVESSTGSTNMEPA